jgi:uncharacterized protein with HEPN domain
MRDDRARLIDMVEAITSIEKYAILGKDRFLKDELIRAYIIYQLQPLGEAASKLSPALRERHTAIPWPKVLGIRRFRPRLFSRQL